MQGIVVWSVQRYQEWPKEHAGKRDHATGRILSKRWRGYRGFPADQHSISMQRSVICTPNY